MLEEEAKNSQFSTYLDSRNGTKADPSRTAYKSEIGSTGDDSGECFLFLLQPLISSRSLSSSTVSTEANSETDPPGPPALKLSRKLSLRFFKLHLWDKGNGSNSFSSHQTYGRDQIQTRSTV